MPLAARTRPESNRLNLTVKHLAPAEAPRWDAFVQACPRGTFFHLSGWQRVIENTLGHPTHYLYVDSEAGIQGVLPLGHVKSWLFGNALISTRPSRHRGLSGRLARGICVR